MNRFLCFSRFVICITILSLSNGYADDYYVSQNSFEENINLSDDMVIKNYGNINNIYTNGYNLHIYNYGSIGIIHNPEGIAYVQQCIPNNNALNKINLDGGNFGVEIDNLDEVSLNTLKYILDGVDGAITVTNSSIVIDNFEDWQNWDANIKLDNTDTLVILNPDTVTPGQAINHVNGPIRIIVKDLDKYYKTELSQEVGAVLIDVIRETDYTKEFKDERGELLDKLRSYNPNDSLLVALDSATSSEALHYIMDSSYHFNSNILLKPVKTVTNFMLSDNNITDDVLYAGISGFYIFADNTDDYGIHLYMGGKYNDSYFGAGFDLHSFHYKDLINDFGGWMYGFNVNSKMYFDNLWIDGLLGISFVNFNVDDVLYKDTTKNNPMGFLWYGTFDIGYDYSVISDFVLSPFVGVFGTQYLVLNIDDKDCNIRGGMGAKYSFVTDNVKYVYSGKIGVADNKDVFGGLSVGFISEIDKAGVTVECDFLKTENEKGYKISVNGHLAF